MKIICRTIGVTVVSVALVLTTGCVNPDGTPNNTGMGALIGGAMGAITGAAIGGQRHGGQDALIGAAAGVIAGAIAGNIMDHINADQRAKLQQQSPQTLQTIQHNDEVVKQQQQAAQAPAQGQAPPAEAVTPLSVDDVKALTAAGVKTDAIKQEIEVSKATFSAQDIAVAQQANVDPAVIECMKSHSS